MPRPMGRKTSIEREVWASFAARQTVEISSWSEAASSASGKIPAVTASKRRGTHAGGCIPALANTIAKPARLRIKPANESRPTASHFPNTISRRRTRFISKGSNDWRSRSPATVSMATFMPPTNRSERKQPARQPFPQHDLPPADPVHQQRQQRLAFPFAGYGVHGDVHASHKRGHQGEDRHHPDQHAIHARRHGDHED